jgi:hypothetical protein
MNLILNLMMLKGTNNLLHGTSAVKVKVKEWADFGLVGSSA